MTSRPDFRPGFLDKQRIVAAPEFNRWRVPPASIAIHLCIGSVYAWSIFNPPLTRLRGVVAPAAGDWTLAETSRTFVVAIVFLGLSAAVAGRWLERVGPRVVGTVAACCWGGGFLVAAMGIALHKLWLLYLGYGVLGGCGLGLGYVSPVSTLIRWFPDRRGLAAGLAIMGFGGGSIIAVPLNERLLAAFYRPPIYVGPIESVSLKTINGRRTTHFEGATHDVVLVAESEVATMTRRGPAGVYVTETGNVGATETFCILGVAYFLVMLAAAWAYRIPAPDWRPPSSASRSASSASSQVESLDVEQAVRTPQFYLLWTMLCLNVTAGIGVLAVAKTMLSEIFGTALPAIVTDSFARTFVLMTGVFNMLGRFVWASASDYLGRRRTYAAFFALGSVCYLVIPWTAERTAAAASPIYLWIFYGVSMLIFTMYGGGFATTPAYLADLFGTRFVGAIHGRLLTAWSVAGVLGPELITALREHAIARAAAELAKKIDAATFAARFGAPIEQLDVLLRARTVTIAKLMEIAPAGTLDPTATLYNHTMLLMAGLLVVGFVANWLVRPIAPSQASETRLGS